MEENSYCGLVFAAERLDVSWNDGGPLGLAEFQRLGNEYWQAFANRRIDGNQ
jgi:hypothetical protein